MTDDRVMWLDGFMSNNTTKMIGRDFAIGHGVGGGKCRCCGEAPGKQRKVAKRSAKRSERAAWKKEAGVR